MNKSLARQLPSSRRRTPIVLPGWLKEHAEAWAAEGAIAVVLFGSRGLGFALPDSDWDIAVVFEEKDVPPPDASPIRLPDAVKRHHEVNEIVRSIEQLSPSLSQEIAHGVSLVGDFQKLLCQQDYSTANDLKKREYINHLAWTYIEALHCLANVSSIVELQATNQAFEKLSSKVATMSSASSAERSVKALCCMMDLGYHYTHNVAKLADQLPKEWYDLVIRMNGTTHRGHMAAYEVQFELENCGVSLQRIRFTLELTNLILKDRRCVLSQDDQMQLQEKTLEQATMYLHILSRPESLTTCRDIAHTVLLQIDSSGKLAAEWQLDSSDG